MRRIVNQKQVVNFLINSFQQNRVSHAYLFLGPEGVGKNSTAKFFAQFINCEKRGLAPCLACSACLKIEHNNHPDVYWIKPEEGSQGIKIEAIRELRERISLKPYEANFKIFILEKADFLLEDAANCLLKTLEEPPGDSILVLIAEEKERFPSTILSRCQIIKFSLLGRNLIEDFLEKNYRMDKGKASLYSKIAEGSLGKAITLVESDYLKRRDRVLEKLIEKKDFNDELLWKEKNIFLETIKFLSGILRDALWQKFGLERFILNIDCEELISKIALRYTQEDLYNLIERFNFYYNFIQNNANLRLVFTNLEMDLEH